jgi:hypothetical protein
MKSHPGGSQKELDLGGVSNLESHRAQFRGRASGMFIARQINPLNMPAQGYESTSSAILAQPEKILRNPFRHFFGATECVKMRNPLRKASLLYLITLFDR